MKHKTPNPVHRYIGKHLFELRMAQSITLTELATTIHVTPAHLRAIEFGHRKLPLSHMFRIAKVLEVSTEEFYEGMEEVVPLSAIIQHNHYIQKHL